MLLSFPNLDAALVGHWRFDETAGTTATDSASGHNGTNNGADINQTGKIGRAYDFVTANTDSVSIANHADFSPNSITVSAWVNTTATGVDQVFSRDNSGSNRQWQFRLNNGNVSWIPFVGGSPNTGNSSTSTVNDGTWHHIAGTYDAGTGALDVWVDGVSEHNETVGGSPNLDSATSTFYIGRSENGDPGWFEGMIDDVRFYSDARSSAEISDIANLRYRWNVNANGNWSGDSNWRNEASMSHQDANFYFDSTTTTTAGRTITVDSNVTAGSLTFDDNHSITLQSNSITFDVSSGNAAINLNNSVGNGAHNILSNLVLNDDLVITQNSTANIDLDGVISGTGGLTRTGAGAGPVILEGDNTYSGVTVIADDRLRIDHLDALGDTGSATNTTIDSGGILQIQVAAGGTLDNENFWIAGTGDGVGAIRLRGSSGDVDITGSVTLTADASIEIANSDDTLTLSGTLTDGGGGHKFTVADDGTLAVSGTMSLTGDIVVDTGTLARTAGSGDSDLYIAEGAGVTQTVSVINGGDITVASDLFMSGTATSNASMVVDGNGSTVTVSNTTDIGRNGTATLTVQGGATFTSNSHVKVGEGVSATGDGSLIVTGSGTTFNVSGAATDLVVGNNSGNGNLLISNSAVVTVDDIFRVGDEAASSGVVTIQSGGSLSSVDASRIGQNGQGSMVVTGSNSTFTVANDDLRVGQNNGSNGYLSIANGATLTNTGTSANLRIGVNAGAIGSVNVAGAGATALLYTLVVGDGSSEANEMVVSNSAGVDVATTMIIAEDVSSVGAMTIASGADVTVTGSTYVANNGTGSLALNGSGSTLNVARIHVGTGSGANGNLSVSSGAVLSGSENVYVGFNSGSIGSASISGAGTTASFTNVVVGYQSASDNYMEVSNTANLTTSAGLYLGDQANSNGIMTIRTGADVVTATTYIGNLGTGALTIDGTGSTLTATTVNVGNLAGSVGTLTLSNSGTIDAATVNLNNTGSSFTADTIAIGNAAAEIDTLNINTGTTASATTIDIGTGGNLNLARSDGITGSSNMTLTGGTFTTNGNDQAAGGLGTLTMTANSVIDVGAGAIINWAVLDETAWTGTLSIHNWSSGKHNGSGSDQLIFADHTGFLQSTHGLQIKFYSDGGTTLVGSSGYFIGNALVAAPEPGTWVGIVSLGLFGIYFEIRRRRGFSRRHPSFRSVEL